MIKDYQTENIQTILLAGHGQVGKTTFNESLLAAGGAISEPGQVDKGNTVSDFDEEEIARKMSLKASLSYVEYKDKKINLIDTPGSPDFIGEVRAGMHVADSICILVDAESGVQIETEKHARMATEFHIPRIAFVNKMDKENADFDAALNSITEKFGKTAVPMWLPIGKGSGFSGVVDLLKMKALTFEGNKVQAGPIPDDMKAAANAAHEKLIEAAAEGDDTLTEKFLEGQTLTDEEIATGLDEVLVAGSFIPVICGGGNSVACASAALDFFLLVLPNASQHPSKEGFEPGDESKKMSRETDPTAPFSAFVFKTMIDQYAGKFSFFRIISGSVSSDQDVQNVNANQKDRFSHLLVMQGKKTVEMSKLVAGDIGAIAKLEAVHTGFTFADPASQIQFPKLQMPQAVYSVAVVTTKKGDEQKMATVLGKLCEEDPTLIFHYEPEIRQSLLSAMGDLQIDIALAKLKKKYNIEVAREVPHILYKETIQKTSKGHHKHKKQSGGHGQYGEVYLEISPRQRGEGYDFADVTVGGSIPKGYIPGVEKGVKQALQNGVLAKYPVIDVGIKVVDGSFHDVDSSEMSFKIAARKAFADAMQNASPVLLEPVMHVKIYASDTHMGAITSDLNSRRGRVLSMGTDQIEAHIPQAELQTYSMDLKAMTSGTAGFEMEFSHYQPISGRIADNVIKEAAAILGDIKEED